jgi:hypothetical protein
VLAWRVSPSSPRCTSCIDAPTEQVAGALSRLAATEAITPEVMNARKRLPQPPFAGAALRKNPAVGSSMGKKLSMRIS